MKNFKYFLLFTILLWMIGFWYMFANNGSHNSNSKNSDYGEVDSNYGKDSNKLMFVVKRLEKNLNSLENKYKRNELIIKELREQSQKNIDLNQQLGKKQAVIKNINSNNNNNNNNNKQPSLMHEEIRRKIYDDIKDVSYFVEQAINELNEKIKDDLTVKKKVEYLKGNFKDRIQVILSNFHNLSISDHYGEWRQSESVRLGNEVQEKFRKLQNPTDCENSQKVICDLNKACGFGCQIHHIMYCFIVSYFTKRVMILESDGWRYNAAGYEAYYKPLSETCTKTSEKSVPWNDPDSANAKVVKMPIIDVLINRPSYLPLSIPKEYSDTLNKIHGDPFTWWAGQILTYLMRFNEKFAKTVSQNSEKLKFKTPCVGIHVRRSDKIGSEASFHHLKEYMQHVEEFFSLYTKTHPDLKTKNVYIATDEVSVILEAKSKYPDYNFIFDESNAKSAAVNQRYTPTSAQGVILDIYFLSECDYLVCTFSSQVCRIAYELMQVRYPDGSWRFKSLDDVYYYGGQNGHYVIAVIEHTARKDQGEIDLNVGDKIGLAGNHWNGYSKGKNLRTNMEGLFPSYKVKNFVESV